MFGIRHHNTLALLMAEERSNADETRKKNFT
jgi:hypothetical protein